MKNEMTDKKIGKYIEKLRRKYAPDWVVDWGWAGPHDTCTTNSCKGDIATLRKGRAATMVLSIFFKTNGWNKIKTTIRHEVLHLLLEDMYRIGEVGLDDNMKGELEAAEHRAIRMLEDAI